MKVTFLEPADSGWTSFLETSSHDFHHLPAFVRLSAQTTEPGTGVAALAVDGDRRMLLPLVLRNIPDSQGWRDATSPYGYPGPLFSGSCAHEPDFVQRATSALIEELRNERVLSLFVRMHPVLDSDFSAVRAGALVTHGETVVIDLSLSEAEQWRQVESGHRNQINRAIRAGHEGFIDADWEHFDDFVRIYTQTMQRLNASDYYFFDADYFRRFRQALGNGAVLAGVRIEGRVGAIGIFTEFSGVVQFHLSGTDSDLLRHRPSKFMLHHVRQWAAARGNRWFHLGGGFGGQSDSLFAFKKGFSDELRTFHTWRTVTDDRVYRDLVLGHEAADDPADLTGYFPAYRRPVPTPAR